MRNVEKKKNHVVKSKGNKILKYLWNKKKKNSMKKR